MQSDIIAQLIEECRDKAEAYLRCAEALAKLLPEPNPVQEPVVARAPRPVRRVLGSQADYQAAILAAIAQTDDGVGIAALTAQTGINRHSIAVALRALQADGAIRKVGDFKTAIYRKAAEGE